MNTTMINVGYHFFVIKVMIIQINIVIIVVVITTFFYFILIVSIVIRW